MPVKTRRQVVYPVNAKRAVVIDRRKVERAEAQVDDVRNAPRAERCHVGDGETGLGMLGRPVGQVEQPVVPLDDARPVLRAILVAHVLGPLGVPLERPGLLRRREDERVGRRVVLDPTAHVEPIGPLGRRKRGPRIGGPEETGDQRRHAADEPNPNHRAARAAVRLRDLASVLAPVSTQASDRYRDGNRQQSIEQAERIELEQLPPPRIVEPLPGDEVVLHVLGRPGPPAD